MIVSAELGQNTNGSLETALRMIETAAACGADAVKVQAYETGDFLPPGHPDWDMFESNRLSWDAIEHCREHAAQLMIQFGATPTSLDGVQRLAWMGADFLKNGSDYLLRHDMIDAMLATGIETWVSCGMATADEIRFLIDRTHVLGNDYNLRLMACTSAYPCPDDEAHLRRVDWGFRGYSDHTEGIEAGIIACALGAEMLEKHFTLDKTQHGPDHAFSADPAELAALVRAVRRTEKLLGSHEQRPTPSEATGRDRWRVTVEEPLRR